MKWAELAAAFTASFGNFAWDLAKYAKQRLCKSSKINFRGLLIELKGS